MMKRKLAGKQGFTLIEILLVVAAIAILAGIVILAINPGKQLGETRNAQRKADVNTILNAVYQYSLDNGGQLPQPLRDTTVNTAVTICRSEPTATPPVTPTCPSGNIDLSALTASGTYIVGIPRDPSSATADLTGYQISRDDNGRVTVSAPSAEQGASITITR